MTFLGIDIGTTKIAAVAVDTTASRIVHSASREHRADLKSKEPWAHRQDPDTILAVAHELVEECLAAAPERVEGICVSGQMHGILYLDSDGRPLSALHTWLDARGAVSHPAGGSYAERLSLETGYRLAPGFGSVTHYYNNANGLVPDGAASACTILDYVTMRLAGLRQPLSDATTAASLGLFDLERLQFDEDALGRAGFHSVAVPRLAAAGSTVGRTPDGIAVFAPVADNQASFVGSVAEPERSVLVNVGTAGQISLYSSRSTGESPETEVRPYPGGGYLHVGAALCAGKAYEHLRAFYRSVLRAFGADPERVDYEAMNRLAAAADPEGAGALVVDTRFAGTRLDPLASGSVGNIRLDNLTPERLARGYIEGIADELFAFYTAMRRGARADADHIIASGNGLRTNAELRAAFRRRFGRPLELPLFREEAALGAALCAAVGAGQYPDFRSAGALIRYEQ